MKTKSFLLVCLFIGAGLTQLYAQNGKNGTGAAPELKVWDGYYIDIPVKCNNAEVDRLVGKVTMHVVLQYKLGDLLGDVAWYNGEVTSAKTGEVFSVKDHYKYVSPNLYGSGHCNLMGNEGSHYILFYTYDFTTDTFTFEKAVCK